MSPSIEILQMLNNFPKVILSKPEAARILNTSRNSFWNVWVDSGILQPIYPGTKSQAKFYLFDVIHAPEILKKMQKTNEILRREQSGTTIDYLIDEAYKQSGN